MRAFTVKRSDIDRCPERRLDVSHYREDGTCMHRPSEQTVRTTDEFNMIWQNDADVYRAVCDLARDLLRRVPGMTDQTLGRNIKDRVFAWAYGGGWGYSDGWNGSAESWRDADRFPDWTEGGPPPGYRASPFSYFLDRAAYGFVSEERVGEEARDALDLEDGEGETSAPETGWTDSTYDNLNTSGFTGIHEES